uniref:RNA polymerase sigma-70 factor n=1 Tax=uncultured bacterium Contig39 TaxID=1393565 RepID=W0FPM1_9BACT|nr:RNA polymerase sigma-70 factor [uncultured bacterium Contig39]
MTSQAFQAAYLPLAERFWQVAWYILEDAAEADDAVQELFLRLWERRDVLDGIHSPKAYGLILLRNLCLDRLRQRRRLESDGELPECGTPGRQDEAVDERERLAKVLAAVKSLPERQREVLTLRTLDGLSYEEIARRTGLKPLTLRVLLSQARNQLKRKI